MLLALLSLPALAMGADNEGLALTVGCEGFTSNGGALRLTRDNTGDERETFVVSAVDGAGQVVYAPLSSSFVVGGRVSFGSGTLYRWTAAPTANPITLTISSTAGNGLSEVNVVSISGSCATLSTVQSGVALPGVDGALVSPSVPLGAPVPVPMTDSVQIERLPAYAIANAEALNLRSGPSTKYTIVAVIRGGTRAAVLGRNDEGTWWLLDVNGVRGWAINDLIYLRGKGLIDVPEVNIPGEIQRPTFVTFLPRFVYQIPNTLNIHYVCTAPKGEYYLVGRDKANLFYQIETQCEDGRAVTAWVEAENGAVRNPAGLVFPVTEVKN